MEIDAEKLLSLIEPRSAIFNYKDKEYANKLAVEKLWQEIATEMKREVSECKSKYTSLRNCYSRHLREERSKLPGSRGKLKKIWYLADAMSFLKDFMQQQRSGGSSLYSPQVQGVSSDIKDEDSISLSETKHKISSTAGTSAATSKRSRTSMSELLAGSLDSPDVQDAKLELRQADSAAQTETAQPNLSTAGKTAATVSDLLAGPMMEFLQSKTKPKPPENGNALFFQSLLADCEQLSKKRQRLFRMDMLKRMSELQEEEENEN